MSPQDLEFNEAESHADTEETESDDKQATKQGKGNTSSDSCRGRPTMEAFKAWLDKSVSQVTPKSKLGVAINNSLIETAKANDCEPYEYLEYVFRELPKLKSGDVHRHLLPWYMPKSE